MRLPSQPFAHQGGVVLLAHRGFSGRFPENTMLAFAEAAALPIDGLEMDIYATRDDVLVISHDDRVSRTTNGNGRIQSYSLAELKKLDAGYRFTLDNGRTFPFRGKGLTIPTLEEVLVRFTDLWLNVDIKQHEPWMVTLFCDLIKRHNAVDRLCVGSFSNETVGQFRQVCPDVVSLATRSEIKELYAWHLVRMERFFAKGGHAMQIPPQEKKFGFTFEMASPRFVQAAHEHGMAVHLWTVNDAAEMSRYVDMGVDGLITNFPDRAVEVLGRTAVSAKTAATAA
ncbi:MAG: glycerophosphodiester phosphodiesterase [Anaerolineaceae bacterium]|nr:glycerophosphodiester phosphodiesterase [Anaerolineaceae bacterium]